MRLPSRDGTNPNSPLSASLDVLLLASLPLLRLRRREWSSRFRWRFTARFAALSARSPPRDRRADKRSFNPATFYNKPAKFGSTSQNTRVSGNRHSGSSIDIQIWSGFAAHGAVSHILGKMDQARHVDRSEQHVLESEPSATLPTPPPLEEPTIQSWKWPSSVSQCHCETHHVLARKPMCNTKRQQMCEKLSEQRITATNKIHFCEPTSSIAGPTTSQTDNARG